VGEKLPPASPKATANRGEWSRFDDANGVPHDIIDQHNTEYMTLCGVRPPSTLSLLSLSTAMLEVPVLGLLLFCISVLALRKRKKPILSYPPGPKGYPILGNVLDLPQNLPIWENLASLANRHGTLPSYSVLRKI